IEDTDPYLFDPVKTISNTERSRIDDVLSGTLGFNVRFLKKFEWSTIGNYRTSLRENNTFYKKNTYQASRTSLGINGTIANNRWDILSTSNTLRFKDQKNKHSYGVLAGFEAQYSTSKSSQLQNTNLPTDEFGIENLGIATTSTIALTNYSKNSLLSFFGRLNYAYNNRYLATVNFHTDGSSKFRK